MMHPARFSLTPTFAAAAFVLPAKHKGVSEHLAGKRSSSFRAFAITFPFNLLERGQQLLRLDLCYRPLAYILGKGRLEHLLKDVLELTNQKRQLLEQELSQANAERTRRRTAIDRLLVLIEDGVMKASDPEFANRLTENREAVAALTSRIEVLESQLARGSRKITPEALQKFAEQLREKLHDEDSTLRTAYLRMFVSRVEVSDKQIVISGPKSVLERGVAKGLPRLEGSVPIFDQRWCPEED
jgi:hypothetical protein